MFCCEFAAVIVCQFYVTVAAIPSWKPFKEWQF